MAETAGASGSEAVGVPAPTAAATAGFQLAIDIGGTFTDIVLLGADGTVFTRKVSSSVEDYARAIIAAVRDVFRETGLTPADVTEIRHGTTVASNAILERKGARIGLIATEGFRDVLEIRNLRMPRLYDLTWEKPPVLIERHLRRPVKERVSAAGAIQVPLDIAGVEAAVDALLDAGVEAIAVCLINAYANPVHERAIAAIVEKRAPSLPCCISFEVLPEIKEYERTSTTVINTYVMPIVGRYLESLRRELDSTDMAAPLLLMQSSGGLTTAEAAARLPIHIVESGPAGGAIGAQALAAAVGLGNIVSFDMGGTTAKAALIENGEISRSQEYQVGGGIIAGSRLLTGAGYLLKVPAIDLAEVGAGGGSIVWIDAGGGLQIGPESAGAEPGPVCYDTGGTRPTVTDATVILGHVNPEYLVGGALRLNADRARVIFAEAIATPLGLSLERAAHGAVQIAAASMIRAIRAVSTERGRDPRNFGLFAFGGNGPVFAWAMAEALGMRRILVPPAPGLFSAFGFLYGDIEHHASRTYRRLLRSLDADELNRVWAELEDGARVQLVASGVAPERTQIERTASLHYQGQTFELTVPAAPGPLDAAALTALEEAFGVEHQRTYGHRAGPDEPVELVTLHVIGRVVADDRSQPAPVPPTAGRDVSATRDAYFGPEIGWQATPILARADLARATVGPCIIEEYDATCVVPPGAAVGLDYFGNIVIDLA